MNFIYICPHCKEYVYIEELNCCIFRHGVYKSTYQQINPHMPKLECDKLKELDLIYGCGKPFKYQNNNIVECDYI
jgi:hypothetical protein